MRKNPLHVIEWDGFTSTVIADGVTPFLSCSPDMVALATKVRAYFQLVLEEGEPWFARLAVDQYFAEYFSAQSRFFN